MEKQTGKISTFRKKRKIQPLKLIPMDTIRRLSEKQCMKYLNWEKNATFLIAFLYIAYF